MNASQTCELTILMPCLNEAKTLANCVRAALSFLRSEGIDGEVLVSDNGSTDGSQAIAAELGARVLDVPIRGYGAALYYGTLAAQGRYVIMGDSDDSYDFERLGAFVEKLRQGYDLVMGNRFLGGIQPGAMPWKNRYIGNPLLSGIGRLFFRCPARDFHCGLRGYSREAFQRMNLQTTGMEFASEMVIKATLYGMKITEVPTTLRPDGRDRPPHLRPWRDGWRHLRFMLLYSPRWLFLYPGLFLMFAGLLLGAWLLNGPKTIGSIGLGVHTLLYSGSAIVIGFQAVVFAVLTKLFGIQEGLLPKDERMDRALRYITLEAGLIVGGLFFLGGLGGSLYALGYWSHLGFGGMPPKQTLPFVLPSAFCLILGCQILLSSFFLSILRLKLRTFARAGLP